MQVYNEVTSTLYDANSKDRVFAGNLSAEDEAESLMNYSLNGYLMCNMQGLNMTAGERWEMALVAPPVEFYM